MTFQPSLPFDGPGSWSLFKTKKAVQVTTGISAKQVTISAAIQSMHAVTQRALDDFSASVKGIETVEQVRAQIAGTYVHLVTYASHSGQEDRFAVYEAEKRIAAQYPHLRFEFDLIDRRGYPMEREDTQNGLIRFIRQLPDTEDPFAGDA